MAKLNNMYCSFCGKGQSEVKKLIASPNADCFICSDCIKVCEEIIQDAGDKDNSKLEEIALPTPEEIKARLDDYIIGQDKAKEVLSVAVYNHYKRINYNLKVHESNEIELEKSNVLMIGPTGCGKTLLARTLARILKVPFASADATSLTEAGYVGDDVENILLKLIQNADFDIKKAERGIIYIDEIDKLCRKSSNPSLTRDVGGEGVQQSLLKILEGTIASVPPQGGRKHPHQETLKIDTTNILFICGGAFVNLEKIIKERLEPSTLGFGADVKSKGEDLYHELIKNIQPEDLIKCGFIPEFVGRLPITVGLHDLSEEALANILTQPKNAITKQYKKMFNMEGVEIEFTDDAVSTVAKKAKKLNTGARGLRNILEECMIPIMYSVPSDKTITKVSITGAVIENKEEPKIERAEKTETEEVANG